MTKMLQKPRKLKAPIGSFVPGSSGLCNSSSASSGASKSQLGSYSYARKAPEGGGVSVPSSPAGIGYLESPKTEYMELEEESVEKRDALREFVVPGGARVDIGGLKSSPTPARR